MKLKHKAVILVLAGLFVTKAEPKDFNPENISRLLEKADLGSFSFDRSSKIDLTSSAQTVGQKLVNTASQQAQSFKGEALGKIRKVKSSIKK